MKAKSPMIEKILSKFDTSKYKIVNRRKLLYIMLIDKISRIFPHKKRTIKEQKDYCPGKILAVRVAYIGDVILTMPAIKSLRKKFHESKIYLLTNPQAAELLKNNRDVHEIIPLSPFWFYKGKLAKKLMEYFKLIKKLRKEKFDLAIDFRGDIRNIFLILLLSGAKVRLSYDVGGGGVMLTDIVPYSTLKHKVEFHIDIARYLKAKTETSLKIDLDENTKIFAKKKIKKDEGFLTLGIHPGARMPLKCYPPEMFSEGLNLILNKNQVKLYIICSDYDLEKGLKIQNKIKNYNVNIIKDLSITELAGCISELDIFLCNDSAPMHIASAFDIPTIAIFGPSDSTETGPLSKLSKTLEIPLDCRKRCDENSCSNSSYHQCMSMINPKNIYEAFTSLKDLIIKP